MINDISVALIKNKFIDYINLKLKELNDCYVMLLVANRLHIVIAIMYIFIGVLTALFL